MFVPSCPRPPHIVTSVILPHRPGHLTLNSASPYWQGMGTTKVSLLYKGTACHLLTSSFLSGLESHSEPSFIGSKLDSVLKGHCGLTISWMHSHFLDLLLSGPTIISQRDPRPSVTEQCSQNVLTETSPSVWINLPQHPPICADDSPAFISLSFLSNGTSFLFREALCPERMALLLAAARVIEFGPTGMLWDVPSRKAPWNKGR